MTRRGNEEGGVGKEGEGRGRVRGCRAGKAGVARWEVGWGGGGEEVENGLGGMNGWEREEIGACERERGGVIMMEGYG